MPGERIRGYLGTAAESFIHHGVTDVTAGKYGEEGGPGFATVEIFRFPDDAKAFGAYSTRKDAARRFVPIAGEAYVSKFAVHVWRGPFYIRVTGGAKNAFDSLTRLAALVAERMPEAAMPPTFNLFPERRVPHSERYSADEGLGQKLLGNSFQATFNVDGDVMTGLIIPSKDRTTAATILAAYRGLYIRNGRLLDPIPNLGEDNFTGEDHYLGRAVAFRNGRFVVVFNGYKDRKKLIDLAMATNARIITGAVDGERGR